MKVFELKEERSTKLAEARAINERAGAEKRALTPEEQSAYDALMAAVKNLGDVISREEAIEGEEQKSASVSVEDRSAKRPTATIVPTDRSKNVFESNEYRHAWLKAVVTGNDREARDMSVGTNSSGGYLVTPIELSKQIAEVANNIAIVRSQAFIQPLVGAAKLGIPQLTARPVAVWGSETASQSADSTLAFGRRDLDPVSLTVKLPLSVKLEYVNPAIEQYVVKLIGDAMGNKMDSGYMVGSGSTQPLGLFTASANGITTSQDFLISANGAATTLLADKIVQVPYQIRSVYLKSKNVGWVMNRAVLAQIRLLKDSYGRYLFTPGGGLDGSPDYLCGFPIYVSDNAPSSIAADAYVAVFGDLSNYWIADLGKVEVLRNEWVAMDTSQVNLYGRFFTDGSPVIAESFVRCKCGAAS